MRCHICKEYLKSPVLTTCGHIFCSICIRRNLSVSQKCPLCHEETYESGLRKILLLDGIIHWFEKNRTALQSALKIDNIDNSQSGHSDNNDIEPLPNTAKCPICNKRMGLEELQSNHIDKCLSGPQKAAPPPGKHPLLSSSSSSSPAFSSPASSSIDTFFNQIQPKNIKAKQRLPNLDTSLSMPKLREKMATLKLPTNGNRNQLESRMKEYINLYNSNLDSLHPVSEYVLLNKLKNWENIVSSMSSPPPQAQATATATTTATATATATTHDEQSTKRRKIEHKHWNAQHSSQYNELIKQAKSRMVTKKTGQDKHIGK